MREPIRDARRSRRKLMLNNYRERHWRRLADDVPGRRSCGDKIAHTNKNKARQAALDMQRDFPGHLFNFYKCRVCNRYHVGRTRWLETEDYIVAATN